MNVGNLPLSQPQDPWKQEEFRRADRQAGDALGEEQRVIWADQESQPEWSPLVATGHKGIIQKVSSWMFGLHVCVCKLSFQVCVLEN